MSTVLSENTFGGIWAGEDMISKTILANKSIERGLITPHLDIKNKKVFREADYTPKLQGYAPSPTSQNNQLTLSEFTLDLKKYEYFDELSLETLRTTWESTLLQAGSLNDATGTDAFNSFIFNFIAEQLANYNERLFWKGKDGLESTQIVDTIQNPFPAYSGLLPQAIASSVVQKVPANLGSFAITGIAASGGNTVLTAASGANDLLSVGDTITITQVSGMTEINGLSAVVLDKTATSTVIDLDIAGFSAYVSGGKVSFINTANINLVLAQFTKLQKREAKLDPSYKIFLPAYLEDQLLAANAFQQRDSLFRIIDTQQLAEPIYAYGRYRIEFMEDFCWLPTTIFGATSKDLHAGVDILDEESVMRIIDLREKDNRDLLSARCIMKSDTSFSALKGQNFLLYLPQ